MQTERQVAANHHTKPTDMGCESAGRLLPSASTSATYYYYPAPLCETPNTPRLTGYGESEDIAGGSLVVECGSEALRRDEWFDQVSHHVDLSLFLFLGPRFHPGAVAARVPDDGLGGGGVDAPTSKVLSLAPDDRVVEQVEAVCNKLALEVSRLTSVERPRLRLGQHVNRQRCANNRRGTMVD